jgi:glycosyltransferase involved in cell wall biosynthesis
LSVTELGASWAELEPTRYMSNALRKSVFRRFDLIQVVAGAPSWANAAFGSGPPVLLQVATLTNVERELGRNKVKLGARLQSALWAPLLTQFDRRGIERSAHVFVENEWMLNHVKRVRRDDGVSLAPPGVDTALFFPGSTDQHAPYLFAVARWRDPRKRPDVLLRAFSHVVQLHDAPLDLLLAGPEDLSTGDWALARELGVASRIRYLGMLERGELARRYRGATAFVSSSDEEGLGISIVEAMASGVAVVATRCGGPEFSVDDGRTGLLVPRRDPAALAAAIERVVRDPMLRAELGRGARQRAESMFADEECGAKFIVVWKQFLGL